MNIITSFSYLLPATNATTRVRRTKFRQTNAGIYGVFQNRLANFMQEKENHGACISEQTICIEISYDQMSVLKIEDPTINNQLFLTVHRVPCLCA